VIVLFCLFGAARFAGVVAFVVVRRKNGRNKSAAATVEDVEMTDKAPVLGARSGAAHY